MTKDLFLALHNTHMFSAERLKQQRHQTSRQRAPWPCRLCFRPLFPKKQIFFPCPTFPITSSLHEQSEQFCVFSTFQHSGYLKCQDIYSELLYCSAHSRNRLHVLFILERIQEGQCTWLCQRSVNTCTKLLRCVKTGPLHRPMGSMPMTGWTGSNEDLRKQPQKTIKNVWIAISLWPTIKATTTSNYCYRTHLPIQRCHLSACHCHRHQEATVTPSPSAGRTWYWRVINIPCKPQTPQLEIKMVILILPDALVEKIPGMFLF